MSSLQKLKKHRLLCQVDDQICRSFHFSSPQIQTFIELMSTDAYNDLKATDSRVTVVHNYLQKAYDQLQLAQISLRPDEFGGYGLQYTGDVPLLKGQFLREYIPVEEEKTFTSLSVMATREGSSRSRVMVGPARFVNHSCRPNCEYRAIELNGRKAVQISALSGISAGVNLSTFYGSSFFGEGNKDCLCPNTGLHVIENAELTSVEPVPLSYPVVLRANIIDSPRVFNMRNMKRRLNCMSSSKKKMKTQFEDLRLPDDTDESSSESEEQSDASEDEPILPPEFPQNETEDTDVSIPELFENLEEDFVNQSVVESEDLDLNEKVEVYDLMGVGSQSSFENFVHCVESIITKHGTSDKEASEWLQLSRLAFPNFKIPSFKSLKKKNLLLVKNRVLKSEKLSSGEWCVLEFKKELEQIIQRNFFYKLLNIAEKKRKVAIS